jgi:hypothetical protein
LPAFQTANNGWLSGQEIPFNLQLPNLAVLFEQSVDELSEVNEIIELRVGRFPLPRGKKSASTDCSNTTNLAMKVVNHRLLPIRLLGAAPLEQLIGPLCQFLLPGTDHRRMDTKFR